MNNFYQPKNKPSLLKYLSIKDENTLFLAGATDLMIELKQKRIFDKDFIDLTKLKIFNYIKDYKDRVEIGSVTSIQDIADSKIIKDYFPSLSFTSRHIGSRQIRNRATIGGNIANASQSADTIPVLCALNAEVELLNSKDECRLVEVKDFVTGRGKTCIANDEVLSKIIIPKISKNNYFAKLGSRNEVTISKVNCAIMFELKNDEIQHTNAYFGAIGVKPVKGELLEEYFNGKKITDLKDDEIRKIGFDIVENAIPNRESKYYKRVAVFGVLSDILSEMRRDYEI